MITHAVNTDDVVTPGASEEPQATLQIPNQQIPKLTGSCDRNLRLVEEYFNVRIVPADGEILIYGQTEEAEASYNALNGLKSVVARGRQPSDGEMELLMQKASRGAEPVTDSERETVIVTHRKQPVKPKTTGQAEYVRTIQDNDLTFCIGPAGTGKTFLAMASAVAALREGDITRIVLSRPIVEAGEQLGYLPGDVLEKVEPYLRPLHDALVDIMGFDRVQKHLNRGTIEVMPLAYMRGRTINDAYMVLDEAQNTTPAQMQMFLTRMGFGAKMVVTGDVTQSDLKRSQSGLDHAMSVLGDVEGVGICRLGRNDIVRHPLVQRIVNAYEMNGSGSQAASSSNSETTPIG
ncbi:MAG: PhoH family protein [Armatimonadota bacterium]